MKIEKLCVFCKHWNFDGGERQYSTLTLGSSGSMFCMKGVRALDVRLHNLEQSQFRKLILTAQTCEHYEVATDE